jgi:F-type H+-transporting ATPase subunit a
MDFVKNFTNRCCPLFYGVLPFLPLHRPPRILDMSMPLPETAFLLPVFANVERAAAQLAGKEGFLSFLTNSCLVAGIVLGILVFLANKATAGMSLIPHKWQNFFETVVEFLYERIEGIVGPKQAPKAFPLLATIFVFILTSNYFGLLPGVGTIGWGDPNDPHNHGFWGMSHLSSPVLRPATADLNMTLGIALCFMVVWFTITIKELGFWGFLVHTFGPKGKVDNVAIQSFLIVVFLMVGVIETVGFAFRPVSLSLRLFGNIFAGESLLHAMLDLGAMFGLGDMGKLILGCVAPIPFYFMELLVGLLQAVVFTLLCAVYIQLSTSHDDHGEEHGHGDEHH